MSRHHPPTPLNLSHPDQVRTCPSFDSLYPALTPLPTPPLTSLPNAFWSPQFVFPSFRVSLPEPHLLGPVAFSTDLTSSVDYTGQSNNPNATYIPPALYPACISPQVLQYGRTTFTPLTPHNEDFGDRLHLTPSADVTELDEDEDVEVGEQAQRITKAASGHLAQGVKVSSLYDEETYLSSPLTQTDLPTPGGSEAPDLDDDSWIDALRAGRKKVVPKTRQSRKHDYARMFPPSKNIGSFNHVQKFLHIIASGLYSDLISWSERGQELVAQDAHKFAKQVLPKYYSTRTLESFVRQCTTYKIERLKFRSADGIEGYVFSIPGVTRDSRRLLHAYRDVPFHPSALACAPLSGKPTATSTARPSSQGRLHLKPLQKHRSRLPDPGRSSHLFTKRITRNSREAGLLSALLA